MGILNERIKQMRLQNGYTLSQVADQLNIKEATMQRYESGEIKNIKHETISQLARIFHCSPSYLVGWEDNTSDKEPDSSESIDFSEETTANVSLNKALKKLNIKENDLSRRDISEIVDYVKLLKQKSQMLNAAHERTDITATMDDYLRDEDIMDDENF